MIDPFLIFKYGYMYLDVYLLALVVFIDVEKRKIESFVLIYT